MNDLNLQFAEADTAASRPMLGRVLVNAGIITPRDLTHALKLQRLIDAPLGEILITEGLIGRDELLDHLARQHRVPLATLDPDRLDPTLGRWLPAALCVAQGVVPCGYRDGTVFVATAHPEGFDDLRRSLGPRALRMRPVLADAGEIRRAIGLLYGAELAQRAAQRVPAAQSCRGWASTGAQRLIWATATLGGLAAALVLAPLWTLTLAMLFAFVTLVMSTVLKLAAALAQLSRPRASPTPAEDAIPPPFALPHVSVLVPLLREREIAGKLVERLSALTYPKSLLEVVLVLEADDTLTRQTIARTTLPDWISVIEVPGDGRFKTKPRALNYALDFCKGSIIGVWDAEDAPEADQIEKVVTGFHTAPDDVCCLQGVLDYYNPRANWLARCFTIEYATWWRMILPGVARLGLVIPLGGTTLFFRRSVLEELCGWDAHNVTEDADLGVRLARAGYRTALIPTVTFEEANCRAWPWMKQRSRWLKGFLITWLVHMRAPGQLWRDLGPLRFLGVQTLLLATFAQFACAPLLWSFWITLAGFDHPVALTLGESTARAMALFFLGAEMVNLTISMIAVSGPRHRHLMPFVLSLPFYFPMGVVAALKALLELVRAPFYWDKTMHGIAPRRALRPPPRAVRLPVSGGS